MTTTTDWFLTAATLRSAFEEKHREDGSSFWACVDQVGDDLRDFIRDLHDDELPNNWRYQTIVQILDAIVERSSYSDEWGNAAGEIADQLTSVWTCELAAWVAENGNRASYCDEEVEDGLLLAESSLFERLEAGQRRCIREMAEAVLIALDLQ